MINEPSEEVLITNQFVRIISKLDEALRSAIVNGTSTSGKNDHGDQTLAIDEFFDKELFECLAPFVRSYSSEERSETIVVNPSKRCDVFVDPLDGSKNVVNGFHTGTIISVKDSLTGKVVSAAYALHGAITTIVRASEGKVDMVQLFNGQWQRQRKVLGMPLHGNVCALNEGHSNSWTDTNLIGYVAKAKHDKDTFRNFGCMVADCHNVFMNGGLFAYPATSSHPHGKLRLLYEAQPMAFIAEQLGGMAIVGHSGQRIVTLNGDSRTTVSVVIGSKSNVMTYMSS